MTNANATHAPADLSTARISARFPGTCGCGCGAAIARDQRCDYSSMTRRVYLVTETALAPATGRTITVTRDGRRSYIGGDTMAVRSLLRAGGCHWDADRKQWWIGSQETALELAERARTAQPEAAPARKITHCVGCGAALDRYQVQHGHKFCSRDCAIERRMGSGWSGYVDGAWHQGSDD